MKTVLIVAGEASGDLLAVGVMRALREKLGEVRFVGVGGDAMQAEGLISIFQQHDLEVMGLVEVLPHIPKLFQRRKLLLQAAKDYEADVCLTIDAPDFSLRVAKKVKRELGIPCAHYVSPSVWAWRKNRVFKMATFLDHVFALFPFEPAYYKPANLPCTFVGHPVLTRLHAYMPQEIQPPKGMKLALFAGSRAGEVMRHLPVMLDAVQLLKQKFPELDVVVPLATHLQPMAQKIVTQHQAQIAFIDPEQRFDVLQTCRAVCAKSGTGNLELGVLGVPHVVGYKMNGLTHWLLKFLVKVPYISPVNWVLGEKCVPEFIQNEMTAKNLVAQLQPLLSDTPAWQVQAEKFANLRRKLAVDVVAEDKVSEILSELIS